MRPKSHLNIVLIIAATLLLGLPGAGLAESQSRIKASPSELVVDGWRLIMPTVSMDEATGQTWVRYDLPGGSYQSYPLDSGEAITEKWYKPGVEGFNTTPGGYSIEDTEEIKNWYMNGGVGEFVIEDGNWTEVTDSTAAAPAADSEGLADTSSSAPAPASDDSDDGPFGSPVDPSAIQTVSTSPASSSSSGPNSDIAALKARYDAARKLCTEQRNNENCENFYRIEKEYIARMNGN